MDCYCSLNDPYIVIQSTDCIEQVFPLSDTWKFISQNKEEKIKKLQETIQLVLNSRAFQTFIFVFTDLSTNFRFDILMKISQFQRKLSVSFKEVNELIFDYINILKDDHQI
jgi:hypothetical protein